MAAAEEVFAQKGYGGTSMSAIAQAAKASIGSLYQFFPSKEAIGIALIERYSFNLQDCWRRAVSHVEPGSYATFAGAITSATLDCVSGLKAFRTLDEAQSMLHLVPESSDALATAFAGLIGALAPEASERQVLRTGLIALQMLKAAFALQRSEVCSGAEVRDEMSLIIEDCLFRGLPRRNQDSLGSPDAHSGAGRDARQDKERAPPHYA